MARLIARVVPLRRPEDQDTDTDTDPDEVAMVAADLGYVVDRYRPVAVAWIAIGADGTAHGSWEALGPSKHALKGAVFSMINRIDRDEG